MVSWSSFGQARPPGGGGADAGSCWVVPVSSFAKHPSGGDSPPPQDGTAKERALRLAKLGLAVLADGRRSKDALRDLDEAVRVDPGCALAYYGRGSYYISQERYDDALAEMDKAIQHNELDAMARFSRGEIFRMQKRYKNALRDLDEAIRLDPLHETACRGRAEVHRAEGRFAEAIADLQRALDIEPSLHDLVEQRIEDIEEQIKDEQVKTLIENGVAHMQQGDDEAALKAFTDATKVKPDCAEAYSSLGTVSHKMGRLEEALGYHERARAIEPKYGGAYFGRAQVYHSQGLFQEALSDYQTALRMRPDMQWQIEPYMQDVQQKFQEKAATAEAELLAELAEEQEKEIRKQSKNRKKKQRQKAKKAEQKAKMESYETTAAAQQAGEHGEGTATAGETGQGVATAASGEGGPAGTLGGEHDGAPSPGAAGADGANSTNDTGSARGGSKGGSKKAKNKAAKKAAKNAAAAPSPAAAGVAGAQVTKKEKGGGGAPSLAQSLFGGLDGDAGGQGSIAGASDDGFTRLMMEMGWKEEDSGIDDDGQPDYLTEEEIRAAFRSSGAAAGAASSDKAAVLQAAAGAAGVAQDSDGQPPVLKAFPLETLGTIAAAVDEATLASHLNPRQLLCRAGLEQFWPIFEREGIVTYDVVCELDENMMRELGLNMGERIKLTKATAAAEEEIRAAFLAAHLSS
eukprot:SAG22_NODE_507_length_9623_cov_11.699286_4_plen_688_part_00